MRMLNQVCPQWNSFSSVPKQDHLSVIPSSEKTITVHSTKHIRNLSILDSFLSFSQSPIHARNCKLHLTGSPQIYLLIPWVSTRLGNYHVLPTFIQLLPNKDSWLQACFIYIILPTGQICAKCNLNHVIALLINFSDSLFSSV